MYTSQDRVPSALRFCRYGDPITVHFARPTYNCNTAVIGYEVEIMFTARENPVLT